MILRTIGLLVTLALGFLVALLTAEAQPVGKVYRSGYLAVGLSPTPFAPYQSLDAFRLALRDLGYVEGRNLLMEYRWGELKRETLPALAAELVIHLKTAKELGLTIPPTLLFQADEVIK